MMFSAYRVAYRGNLYGHELSSPIDSEANVRSGSGCDPLQGPSESLSSFQLLWVWSLRFNLFFFETRNLGSTLNVRKPLHQILNIIFLIQEVATSFQFVKIKTTEPNGLAFFRRFRF